MHFMLKPGVMEDLQQRLSEIDAKLEKLNASNERILNEIRELSVSISVLYKKGDEILDKSNIHVDSLKEEIGKAVKKGGDR